MALTSLRTSSRPLVIPPPGLICTQSSVVYVGAFLKSPLLQSATKAFTTSRTSCSSSAPHATPSRHSKPAADRRSFAILSFDGHHRTPIQGNFNRHGDALPSFFLHYLHHLFQRLRTNFACPCKGMVKNIYQK